MDHGMTDIHTHILPGVDDGAEDLEDARMMAELAVESGVKTIVCTPHCNIPGDAENYWSQELADRMQKLSESMKEQELPIQLLPGMEIYTTSNIAELIRT
ncbi:MAG: hypothetical protein LUH07_05360, partial [Lachnospiraceae bacterium]|nr:hypothetical protein [Lachnospiraceae bacterium]